MDLEENWIERYHQASDLASVTSGALVGFNAHIDVIYDAEKFEDELEDIRPARMKAASNRRELLRVLKHAVENGENSEVELEDLERAPEGGSERIGGQGGIMAKYLAATGDASILYTPEVSGKLADCLGDRILYPEVEDSSFVLKNVQDCVNSERTKKNMIFEYSGDEDGRIIFSSQLKGFGAYFDSEIEPHLGQLDGEMDRFLLSGFHDAEGNVGAKLEKARRQLKEIDTPVHHEYVHRPGKAEAIIEKILQEVESIGLDSRELGKLSDMLGIETDVPEDPGLGESFAAAKGLIEHLDLDRVHIHTMTHHVVVASESYPVSTEKMRDGLLYGVLSGAEICQQGSYPSRSEIEDFSMKGRELHGIQELQDFGDFLDLENFAETGTAETEGLKVAAVPSLIVEEPEKLVGLGDVISCGSFVGETKQQE